MHDFLYRNGQLHCEEVPVVKIAKEVGTPFYLYSYQTLRHHFRVFDKAFQEVPHLICFAAKANSNLALLKIFAREGGGADIVSGGELYRALKAGIPAKRMVFAGVGKTDEEIAQALRAGILMFNVESPQELIKLSHIARRMKKKARVALRVNPDIDPKTHPYIATGLKKSKFGIAIHEALEHYLLAKRLRHLEVVGIHKHIGSQLMEVGPFVDAFEKVLNLVKALKAEGIPIRYLDVGGGLGITYKDEAPPHPVELARALVPMVQGLDLTLIFEPGRVLVGNAGILVTKVLYTKRGEGKTFVIVDAAMNDLVRPSLYGAYHEIQHVREKNGDLVVADVVGPICESGDFLAKDRKIPECQPGDLLAVMSAGAYGFTMSSNYNSRPRVPEVMVKAKKAFIIRKRETYADLIRGEVIPRGM